MILTTLFCLGKWVSGQQLNQNPPSMSIQEGEDVTMNCSFTSIFFTLLWYKQNPGPGPVLWMILNKGGELTRNGKLTAKLGEARKDSFMHISAYAPEDVGIYFCAGSTVLPKHLQPVLKLIAETQALCCLQSLLLLAEDVTMHATYVSNISELQTLMYSRIYLPKRPRRADWIRPQETEVFQTEGKNVNFLCTYSASSTKAVDLYWFRQYPNQAPEYILYRGWGHSGKGDASFAAERFYSKSTANSVNLYIRNVVPADAALYYCALRVAQREPIIGEPYKNPVHSREKAEHPKPH
ncbi:T-cell receptor alpha chain V region CTL-L17 [Tupaia chinensis]|nr:T-cell receptor alpha chain V region CTL-L17 [Tupaia chinensis]